MSFSVTFSPPLLISTKALQTPSTRESSQIRVKVYPQWYKQISLEWSVPAEFGRVLFNVYFSQTGDGDWTKLNSTPIDGTFFSDPSTQEYSKFHEAYYVVEALLLDQNGALLRSKPSTWKNQQRKWVELRAIEIQRRESWLLRKFAGVKSYFFRRKIYGERCPHCWNRSAEIVTNDHCPVCLGTSFKGGYFTPAEIYVQYNPTPNDNEKVYFGKLENNQIGAWTIAWPEVFPDDIIVRTGDWGLYKVDRIETTELQANVSRQMMTLTQLNKNDIEYELIKRDLPDFPGEYTL